MPQTLAARYRHAVHDTPVFSAAGSPKAQAFLADLHHLANEVGALIDSREGRSASIHCGHCRRVLSRECRVVQEGAYVYWTGKRSDDLIHQGG